jgi:hypothetical protein
MFPLCSDVFTARYARSVVLPEAPAVECEQVSRIRLYGAFLHHADEGVIALVIDDPGPVAEDMAVISTPNTVNEPDQTEVEISSAIPASFKRSQARSYKRSGRDFRESRASRFARRRAFSSVTNSQISSILS